jgi:hypothetical protein
MVCKQSGCGYVFPKGMQITGKCPDCDKSPFYDYSSRGSTFTKKELELRREELKWRKFFPLIEKGEMSLFERAA